MVLAKRPSMLSKQVLESKRQLSNRVSCVVRHQCCPVKVAGGSKSNLSKQLSSLSVKRIMRGMESTGFPPLVDVDLGCILETCMSNGPLDLTLQ